MLAQLIEIINVLVKVVTAIVKNRKYKRIRVKPSTKWNEYGNRYGKG